MLTSVPRTKSLLQVESFLYGYFVEPLFQQVAQNPYRCALAVPIVGVARFAKLLWPLTDRCGRGFKKRHTLAFKMLVRRSI